MIDGADIFMRDPAGQLEFIMESFDELFIFSEVGPEELERHDFVDLPV
jgi:hypothetical protein